MASPELTLPEQTPARPLPVSDEFRRAVAFCIRWLCAGAGWGLSLGCVSAVLLRWTWKDSQPAFSAFFYATPLALIWIGFAAASFCFLVQRNRRLAVIAGLAAVLCWGWWQQGSATAHPNRQASESFRAVVWNIARLKAGWPNVAARIKQMESPIMGFVEAGPDKQKQRRRWREEFPNHEAVYFGNGMVLLVEGKIGRTSRGSLGYGCFYGSAAVEIDGKPLTILLVDLYSNPCYSREAAFQGLSDLVERSKGGPILVLGDFNTPADSVHADWLRRDLQNAFEVAGKGRAETWPAPFPVLAIDQIWLSPSLNVQRTRYAWSLESDHRAVLAEFAFSEK